MLSHLALKHNTACMGDIFAQFCMDFAQTRCLTIQSLTFSVLMYVRVYVLHVVSSKAQDL